VWRKNSAPKSFLGDGMIGGSFYERMNGQVARLHWSKPKNKSFLSFFRLFEGVAS
jgi:hypothetical protein